MSGLMGPQLFDQKAQQAKLQMHDALNSSQRIKPLFPPPQPPVQMPMGMGITPQGVSVQGQTPAFGGMMSGQANFGLNGFQGMQGQFNAPVGAGNLSLSAAMDQAMRLQNGQVNYNRGPFNVSAGYSPNMGANVNFGYRREFQEGGLATSVRSDPTYHDRDVDFINTRNSHMREVVGKGRPFAQGGLAMAGAWTRKEGKDPEGGLNAKGRASLKAQGHDIKPPVSAKQAKKSPKAAARRRSFCARMGGMEGPMKDENGKPTRKALALRKWDC